MGVSFAETMMGPDRSTRDQLIRASRSVPLNIAEGNGKRPGPDRLRSLQIAHGSAPECAAILDVLVACHVISTEQCLQGKEFLDRTVSMLVRMTMPHNEVRKDISRSGSENDEYECECGKAVAGADKGRTTFSYHRDPLTVPRPRVPDEYSRSFAWIDGPLM